MQDADTIYAITWQSLRNVVVVNVTDEYSGTMENKKWQLDISKCIEVN